MSNVAYISTRKEEGIMTSLGMEHIRYDERQGFDSLIRELKHKRFMLVFVSETIYNMHQKVIERYNTDLSMSIHVLANALENQNVGKKRLRHISEDAVGFYSEQE